MLFDEFIISFDLDAELFLKSQLISDGLQHHGAGFLFSFLLRFQSMFSHFVEALFEFSGRHWMYIYMRRLFNVFSRHV